MRGVRADCHRDEWFGGTDGFRGIDVWNASPAEDGLETPVNTRVLGDCFDTTFDAGLGNQRRLRSAASARPKVQWFFPSRASWENGDRALLCAASP